MRIRWSFEALSDLESIRAYIAQERPAAARKIALRIREAAMRLERFPLSGRRGRVAGTRELIVPGTSYICAYTVQSDEVRIAAVLHGKRLWPETF
jgi:addiction module RelE/StbE family toxin